MRQAYDYWQDQPDNSHFFSEPAVRGANAVRSKFRRGGRVRRSWLKTNGRTRQLFRPAVEPADTGRRSHSECCYKKTEVEMWHRTESEVHRGDEKRRVSIFADPRKPSRAQVHRIAGQLSTGRQKSPKSTRAICSATGYSVGLPHRTEFRPPIRNVEIRQSQTALFIYLSAILHTRGELTFFAVAKYGKE